MAEVEITQYLRPHGNTRKVHGPVSDEVYELAQGMKLSSEVLTTGQVAIYGRLETDDEEDEYMELATNGPGDTAPNVMLEKVIRKVAERRNGG